MLRRRDVDLVIKRKTRGFIEKVRDFLYICTPVLYNAQMAKLVDALSSGGSAARCAGSNPVLGTIY